MGSVESVGVTGRNESRTNSGSSRRLEGERFVFVLLFDLVKDATKSHFQTVSVQ